MSIILVGGIDRLGEQYRKEAEELGMDLSIFSQAKQSMGNKIKHADAVVIFTNKVSHQARHEAFNTAKKQGIPVFMHHACGVCTLRECLNCLSLILQAGTKTHTNPGKESHNRHGETEHDQRGTVRRSSGNHHRACR